MKNLIIFPLFLLFSLSLFGLTDLENLGRKYVSQKDLYHGYLSAYDLYFSPLRNRDLNILEIGYADGSSALMWEEYFPSASLHFVDNDAVCLESIHNLSSRSLFHFGDQSDAHFLSTLVNLVGDFDIIIDDASHFSEHQIFTFKFLFPHLKAGGIYVIEDLHTSYWSHFGGAGEPGNPQASPYSCTEFLKSLIDEVNYVGAYTGCANRDAALVRIEAGADQHGVYHFPKDFFTSLDTLKRDIKSIHFYDSICFIFKR